MNLNDAVMYFGVYASEGSVEQIAQKLAANKNWNYENTLEWMMLAAEAVNENHDRRKFVVSYMHYTGENCGKLTAREMWQIYCQADGYGWRRSAELKNINGGWDWSHIRDSTIDGWKRMEKKLNAILKKKEL